MYTCSRFQFKIINFKIKTSVQSSQGHVLIQLEFTRSHWMTAIELTWSVHNFESYIVKYKVLLHMNQHLIEL